MPANVWTMLGLIGLVLLILQVEALRKLAALALLALLAFALGWYWPKERYPAATAADAASGPPPCVSKF